MILFNSTSDNKRINGFGLKPFTQSLLRKPSFIRRTLCAIGCLEGGKREHWQNISKWDDKNG